MSSTTFPDDLVRAQQDLMRTYAALAAPESAHCTALRRRLLRLSGAVFWHPYWSTRPGRAGLPELRERARTEPVGARS